MAPKPQASPPVGKPRYKQMAETLMANIRSGQFKVGELMPGEHELVSQFGVSRHTVRESLRMLEELGLIERHRGHGTVVKAKQSAPSYVQMVSSPNELLQYPKDSKLKVIETENVVANRALARKLHCRSGTAWLRIGAIRKLTSGLPICWTDVYVLPEYADVATKIGRRHRPVYEIIEQMFDEQINDVEIDICADVLDSEKAKLLEVEPGSPSLTLIRRYVGRGQRQFEVSVSQHPAEHYNYSLKLKRGWQSGGGWTEG